MNSARMYRFYNHLRSYKVLAVFLSNRGKYVFFGVGAVRSKSATVILNLSNKIAK
jgi:hypothetical protein